MVNPLLPIRHPNQDFFVCDIFDALPYFKDDMASMEHPVFSLSTKPDMRTLYYEHNGNSITIKPGADGLATIYDKDILLYCTSYLRTAIQGGHEPKQRMQFVARDLLVSTNRGVDGRTYENLQKGLERLSGTRIQTNLKTGGLQIESGFGLIDAWHIVKEAPNGRMIAVEVKLSDWFYHSILANELLTINRDYFRLRKPIERRLYELARKHCGDQVSWKVRLETLHKKIGTTAPLRKLRVPLLGLTATDHLPDYSLALGEDDIITFTNRNKRVAKKEKKARASLLRTQTYENARRAAPGWDIYLLEQEWREWSTGKGTPLNPDAAFVGFCKQRFRRQGRP
jgi:plasmid replication initiation protein